MSAQSLQNKSLQLAELIVSNEKYQDSAGYVASSATFDSSLTSCALSVPSITTNQLVLGVVGSASFGTLSVGVDGALFWSANGGPPVQVSPVLP